MRQCSKAFCILLTVLLCLGLFPLSAMADTDGVAVEEPTITDTTIPEEDKSAIEDVAEPITECTPEGAAKATEEFILAPTAEAVAETTPVPTAESASIAAPTTDNETQYTVLSISEEPTQDEASLEPEDPANIETAGRVPLMEDETILSLDGASGKAVYMTGYENLYRPVLNMFYENIQNNWADVDETKTENKFDDVDDPHSVSHLFYTEYNNFGLDQVGYAFYDINGDGTPELMVSTMDSGSTILDLYTIYKNGIVHVFTNYGRGGFALQESGVLYFYKSWSAFEGREWLCQLLTPSNSFVILETLSFDVRNLGSNVWRYTNNPTSVKYLPCDIYSDAFDTAISTISTNQAEIIRNRYKNDLLTLQLTPFSQYRSAVTNGLVKTASGWQYWTNGTLDTSYTGMAKNAYGWWYVKNGKLDLTYTGMAKNAYGWWYIKNGKLDTTYTGMAKNAYGWWYMKNGKLDKTYTGMAKNAYGWWYMTNGKLDLTYTGMAKNAYGWWYIKNGKLDKTFTGIASNVYGTWYMVNGKLATSFTGTITYSNRTYSVVKGRATLNTSNIKVSINYPSSINTPLTITAKQNGNTLWSIVEEAPDLDSYPLDSYVEEIGVFDNQYYYLAWGVVCSRDIQTGKLLWKNTDFCGGGALSTVASDGTIYLTAVYGPQFVAISNNGITLKKIYTLDKNLHIPFMIRISSGNVHISFDYEELFGHGTTIVISCSSLTEVTRYQ